MKPVHPDQCIKEEEELDDDDDQEEQEQNNPPTASFAPRYREGEEEERMIQSPDLPVTPMSNDDVNDLKDDLAMEDATDDVDDDDMNEDKQKKKKETKNKRRIKSDGNMDGEDEDEEKGGNKWKDQKSKKKKKGPKDQSDSNPVQSRSIESVSCSPTNYDLMKEQIQLKCEYNQFLALSLFPYDCQLQNSLFQSA